MSEGDRTGLDATMMASAALDATVASQGAASTGGAALPNVDPACYARLGEYARGGLGRIVRAKDLRTGRVVAVKEMLSERGADAARFAREALVTANLQHPAIVPVYEVGTWTGGEPFYAMKLVAGRPLDEVIAAAPALDARLALLPRLIVVADALAYAHGQGVIHRDLKPANVLAGEFGETVLIDWGLARRAGDPDDAPTDEGIAAAAGAAEGATVMGAIVGTPAYMPPEQALGEAVDERADVYAMGAILYHVLAGHPPYADQKLQSGLDVLARVTQKPPTALATIVPGAPRDLRAIIDKAMARRPEDRYATARELAEELGRFQTGKLVDAHHYSKRERIRRWLRANRAPVAVAVLALIVIAAGSTFAVMNILRERDRATVSAREALLAKDEARHQLAEALIQKGREAEGQFRWDQAAAYYAAAATQHDRDDARWAAGIAESRALAPTLRLETAGKPIHAVAVSADGATIAAAGDDGAVWRWRADGTALAPIAGTSPVHALAFSPRGALAIGDDDGRLRLVDPDTGEIVERAAHAGRVWSVAFSGERLISGGEDGLAKVWTGATAVTLAGHTQRVYAVTASPDGQRVGTASDDRTVRIWPIGGGEARVLKGSIVNGVKAIRFIDDTQVVAGGWDAAMFQLDATDAHELERMPQPGVVNALGISDDRRVVVAAGDHRFVVFLDLATHQPIARLDAGGAPVYGLALTADTLVTGGKDGIVRAWDTRGASRLVRSLGHRAVAQSLEISRDGTRLYSEALDGTVRAWDLTTGQEVWRWADPGGCDHALALRGDAIVVGCTRSGRVVQLDAATGALRSAVTLPGGVTALDVSPAGDQIVAGGGGDHAVRVVDAATMQVVATLPGHGHQIYGIAFAGDGQTFASGGLDQTARRWRRDGDAWTTSAIDEAQDDDIIRLDVSTDGALITTNGETPRIRLWFPDDDARSGWLDGHTARIWTTAISPDGKRLASASLDGTIRLWDVDARRELRQWRPVPVGAYAVTWSPDGTRVAGSFDDGTIIVWDPDTGAMRNAFGRDAAALSGGGCAGRAHAGLDAATLAIVDRACTLEPAAYLGAVLAHERLRLDGVDLVEASWEAR